MTDPDSIRSVGDIFADQPIDVPEKPGVYAFWWIGELQVLLDSNRTMKVKGPGGNPQNIYLGDWWPDDLHYPCLYVGRSTNLRQRIQRHVMASKVERLHHIPSDGTKQKPETTTCQLRYGIEHIFPKDKEPLNKIFNQVGYSYRTEFGENAVAERFYTEDLLIGTWRPWFNVDSER